MGDGTRTHNARNHNPVLCQLNYTHHMSMWKRLLTVQKKSGTPEGTRTPGLLLRRQLLYPAELLARMNGAGDGNRTRIPSLEGWCPGHCAIPAHSPRRNRQLSDINTWRLRLSICFFKNFYPTTASTVCSPTNFSTSRFGRHTICTPLSQKPRFMQ